MNYQLKKENQQYLRAEGHSLNFPDIQQAMYADFTVYDPREK
jgi:hypothetical protein